MTWNGKKLTFSERNYESSPVPGETAEQLIERLAPSRLSLAAKITHRYEKDKSNPKNKRLPGYLQVFREESYISESDDSERSGKKQL